MAAALVAVAGLGEAIEAVDAGLAVKDFPAATASLVSLEKHLVRLEEKGAAAQGGGGDTVPSASLGPLPVEAPMGPLVRLVRQQSLLRRAEAAASLRTLWRFAVTVDEAVLPPPGGSASSCGCEVVVHVSLEGLVAGHALERPLVLGALVAALERLEDGSMDELLGASLDQLEDRLLLPLLRDATRDLHAIAAAEAANPGAALTFDEPLPAVACAPHDGPGEEVPTGCRHTLVFTPSPAPVARMAASAAAPAPLAVAEAAAGPGRKPKGAQRVAVASAPEPVPAPGLFGDPRLGPKLRRLLCLLRDLFTCLDFIAARALGGSLRYAAKAGKRLLADPAKAAAAPCDHAGHTVASSKITAPPAATNAGGGEAPGAAQVRAAMSLAAFLRAPVPASSAGGGREAGIFRKALFGAVEAVAGYDSEGGGLGTVELGALRTGCAELERRLDDLGFLADLPPDDHQDGCALATAAAAAEQQQAGSSALAASVGLPCAPLSVLVAKLPAAWAAKRRGRVLELCRRRMLTTDYHNSMDAAEVVGGCGGLAVGTRDKGGEKGGEGSPLEFPACQVTAVAAGVLRAVHETMALAIRANAEALASQTLFRTAREVLDLFRAVVPQRYAEGIASLPRLAALFHNDCLLLSHASLTLAHPYRPSLPAPLHKTATFVDLAQPLRSLGEQALQRQVAAQMVQLDDFNKGVAWIQDDDEPQDGDDGPAATAAAAAAARGSPPEAAVAACLHHLHHLANLWQPVLSRRVYRLCMGRLLEHATTPLLKAVLGARDIAESATHRIHAALGDLGRAKDALLGPDGDPVRIAVGDEAGAASSAAGASDCCDSEEGLGAWWLRLCTVRDLMVWRLDEINEHLAQGTFRHLSAEELCRLLEALFEDSPKLQRTLTAVRQA